MKETNKNRINVNSLRRLTVYSPNIVKHFVRISARLHGLLALREQLDVAKATKRFETFAQVEMDRDGLKMDIANGAALCARTLSRLNALASEHDIPDVCYRLEELSVSEVIAAVNDYVDELVAQSDYEAWVNEISTK